MNNFAIKIENLSKRYNLYDKPIDRVKESLHPLRRHYHHEFIALDNISFELLKGQTLGVIGNNGSGKSTLLKIVSGVLSSTSGNVKVNGKVLAILELGAGFNTELTGIENIYFNGVLMGATREEINQRIEKICSFADIGEFIHQPVKTYSSGMYMRLAFAVIANLQADILVIDEALSVGDAVFTQKCMRFLRKFREKGTILFVSHDTNAVMNLCDIALWIDKGKIAYKGKAKDVCEKYLEYIYDNNNEQNNTKNHISKSIKTYDDSDFVKDKRCEMINHSKFRNDIEIFEFDSDSNSFGNGGGKIFSVELTEVDGCRLSWTIGGEALNLKVRFEVFKSIMNPIVGFFVKDKLGQCLFGDNTYLTTFDKDIKAEPGEIWETKFEFLMPILPVGEYSICVALAEGNQEEHVQHHWIHDALIFKSHSSSVCTGLIGVPMKHIELSKINNN